MLGEANPQSQTVESIRRPTLLRQAAMVALLSLAVLTLLWSAWLWRASDHKAEETVRHHITEELADFVSLFEAQWPERKAFLILTVQNHASHPESIATIVADAADRIVASHDPTHIGQPLKVAAPDLAMELAQFRNRAFALWRSGEAIWAVARWAITPGGPAEGPEGVIMIGYDLGPEKQRLRRELVQASVGPYAIFLATLLLMAAWLWRFHLVPLMRIRAMTTRNASASEWRAAANDAPTDELVQLALHAAQAREQLDAQARELQLLATAIEASPASVVITNTVPQILWVNPAFEKVTGYTLAEVRGKNPSIMQSGLTSRSVYRELWDRLTAGKVWSGEFINKRKDGSFYHEWAIIAPVRDPTGVTSHYVAVKFDISREKELAAKLTFATTHDAATGLLNRQALIATLDRLLTRQPDGAYALFLIDIAQFSYYNQRYGVAFGDMLLRAVGNRLVAAALANEQIARIGSDEFAMLTPILCSPTATEQRAGPSTTVNEEAQQRLTQLLGALREPLLLPESQPGQPSEITLTWVVGAVPCTALFQNGSQLLAAAALALARAKEKGEAVAWFSDSDGEALARSGQILDGLRAALQEVPEHQGLALFWQPQVQQGVLVGCEALVRFSHPTLGSVSPGEFIPLAESHGLIKALGQWVLSAACRQGALWAREYGFAGTISVNVSPQQLLDGSTFCQLVADALTESGWPGERLLLEITENVLLSNTEQVVALMNQLHAQHGVCWSIDDFGTGYSSLAYLEQLPVHELKIDQHFVRQLDKSSRSLRLVQAIVSIAETFHLHVVAEGVENAACVAALAPFPTLIHQGWFYGRPVPANEFAATWLGRGATNR